jgi:hypothetical protein
MATPTDVHTLQTLVDQFDQTLQWWMSADEYADAIALNNLEPDSAACHTHDYIDSNEAMMAAWQTVTGRTATGDPEDADQLTDADRAFMDLAWRKWREQKYYGESDGGRS